MRRALNIIAGIVIAVIAIVGVGVWVLTGTSYGHERVRKLALDMLKSHVHGKLSIGRIDGNLLTCRGRDDLPAFARAILSPTRTTAKV